MNFKNLLSIQYILKFNRYNKIVIDNTILLLKPTWKVINKYTKQYNFNKRINIIINWTNK